MPSTIVIVQESVIKKSNFCVVTLLVSGDKPEIGKEFVEIFFRSSPVVVFEDGDRVGLETRSDRPSVVTKAISVFGMELGPTLGIKFKT